MIDQLMRDTVEQNRPPSAPNLAIILAQGRVRRRRVRIAQAGAAVLTVSTVAGAVAIGQTLQPDIHGPPPTTCSSQLTAAPPTHRPAPPQLFSHPAGHPWVTAGPGSRSAGLGRRQVGRR